MLLRLGVQVCEFESGNVRKHIYKHTYHTYISYISYKHIFFVCVYSYLHACENACTDTCAECCVAHACAGARQPMAHGSLSAKISFDLRAFRPDFIVVVYDKDSRRRVAGVSDEFAFGRSQKLEQEGWQSLCSIAKCIVKDAVDLCSGNIIFLEGASKSRPSTTSQASEWLTNVRSSGSIVEAALSGASSGHVSDSSEGIDTDEAGIILPWPMAFEGLEE